MRVLAITMLLIAATATCLPAQSVPNSGPDIWLRFQDKMAPVSDYAVTMTMASGGQSLTSRLWRLAPRTRMEFTMANFGTIASIVVSVRRTTWAVFGRHGRWVGGGWQPGNRAERAILIRR